VHEETANTLTCGLGLLLSIAGLIALVVPAAAHGDVWQVVSFSIYGACLIILYTASTLLHLVQVPKFRRLLEALDQSAIYLLIAGTYTPFTLVTIRSAFGWTLFGVVWGLALVGIIVTWLFPAEKLRTFSNLAYLTLGWLIVLGARPLLKSLPIEGIGWLVAGGVIYSAGVPVFLSTKTRYGHAIWHFFVLGGSICHYIVIRFYVMHLASGTPPPYFELFRV
jgi:hemolysin III